MTQSTKTSSKTVIQTGINSTYNEKEATAQITNSDSKYTQEKHKITKSRKVILTATLIILFLITMGIYFVSLIRKQQDNTQSRHISQENVDSEDRNKSLLLQPIEKKSNKIAFKSEGNIWTVNPDGTELEQLTEIDFKLSASQENNDTFKQYFFSVVSLSPDGAHLAASGLSDTIRKAVESNDEELKKKYLAGDYWYPSHLDIYIFNLLDKTNKVIKLENYGFKAEDIDQILGIEWLYDNEHLLLKIQGRNDLIINLNDLSESFQEIPPLGVDGDLFAAYVPEVSSLFFDSIFHVKATSTEISTINLKNRPITSSVIYKLPDERQRSYVVAGTDGNIYFHTLKGKQVRLHQYNVVTTNDEVLLDMLDCDYLESTTAKSCIKLPSVTEGLTAYSEQFISPNGKYVVAALDTNEPFENIGIYRLQDMQKVYPTSNKTLDSFKWSSNGESIVVASTDNRLTVINLQDNKETVLTNDQVDITYESFDWNHLY